MSAPASQPIPKRLSKHPKWQAVIDLAYDYYQDQTNRVKRQTLYDALMRPQANGRSLLLDLSREVIGREIKADLGASITYLSEEVLSNKLAEVDKETGLPLCRPTVMLGGLSSETEIFDKQGGKPFAGKYDPSKGAFHTWFANILRNAFRDYARAYNSGARSETSFGEDNSSDEDDPSGKLGQNEVPDTLGTTPSTALDNAQVHERVNQTIRAMPTELREVAWAIYQAADTGETDKEIYVRLSLTRETFRWRKQKVQEALRPCLEAQH